VSCPHSIRTEIWQRLATDLKPRHLDDIVQQKINLEQLPDTFELMLSGKIFGRTLVEI
jgi:NADPH2:quinone reductase